MKHLKHWISVMQEICVETEDGLEIVQLPDPDDECAPGARWGDASFLLTPAWIAKHGHFRHLQRTYAAQLRPGENRLEDDVVFCLLGGFGIKAEVAMAAHRLLKGLGLCIGAPERKNIEAALRTPLNVNGRSIRYRFPANRARYIEAALSVLSARSAPDDDLELRDLLLTITGIGRKTASFIVRNHRGSDRVAILDIHVIRACQIANLFPRKINIARDYEGLETRFLDFAMQAGIPASILDLTIWDMMRRLPIHRREAAARANEGLAIAGCMAPRYLPGREHQDAAA